MAADRACCCSFLRKETDLEDIKEIVNNAEDKEEDKDSGKVYKRYLIRWLMLFVLFLLNLSNGMMWMTYAPIPGVSMKFYGISSTEVDWFSISFFIVSLIVGFFSMFILDTFGLAPSVISGAVLNFVGSLLRVLGSMPPVAQNSSLYHYSGYILAMFGQILTAAAQPFLLYSPTKFAMFWFGEKERSMANAITSMANPLGIGIAYILSPRVGDVFIVTWIYMIPAAVACLFAFLTFWRGRPPTPPSAGAEGEQGSFFKGLKQVLRNKQMWVLLIVWGMVSGLLNSMLTLLPQFLCPFGYDDNFSGLWIGIMIFVGLGGAFVASVFLDCTRRYEEVLKTAIALAIFCMIWFLEVFNRVDQYANIAVSLCAFGFFGFMVMPTTLEVAVEITYPAPEAASSGLLWSTA
jgi:FLVCR family MFS transporter 7